jgi:hypothetical protein
MRKVIRMWQRMAWCVAGLGAITMSAAQADETTPIANQHAPPGAFVAYLDDDPPAAQTPAAQTPAAQTPAAQTPAAQTPAAQTPAAQTPAAQTAGRVLRMLEILGVHGSRAPLPLPAPVLAATDLPPPSADESPPLETAAPVTYQTDADRSIYEANTPGDAGAFPGIAASPNPLETNRGEASTWPINDLRDPARTNADLVQDESLRDRGLRDRGRSEADAVVSSGESDGSPARLLAGSATPVPRILCPDGMKSSRRTIGRAAAGTNMAPAPAAEPPAVAVSAASETPTVTSATVAATTAAAAATATAAANFDPGPWSAPSTTSLPPLPPLRTDDPFLEPRSIDAILSPRPVCVVKSSSAARDGADVGLAITSDNVEFKPTAMPSPKHRSPALPAPELPSQRVAANQRQPSRVAGGPAREVMPAPLPNTLDDLPPARVTDLPRQIALQSPPQSRSLLPPPATPTPATPTPATRTQPSTPLAPQLPPLQPRRTGDMAAAAEPALLRVAVRESRLLRTAENVVRVVSEHDNICDVLLFNPREIAVVGKQRGTVKVEFWYDGQGLNRVSYLVAVDDERTPDTQSRVDLQKIERLVTYLFPNSRVKLVSDQGRLIVRGSAANQREAVEILSTVRRSQLIPVTDEIVVQPAAK